jgi:hypothetical protein
VALPESIPVRYSDEEAGYVSIRPVVRQTFRLDELLDMILSVAGKDVPRVHQILRSGTVVYHFFRYWWTGIEAGQDELQAALARFPDADPSRAFSPDACVSAKFEIGGANPRSILDLDRNAGSRRRMFRTRSFWGMLVEIAAAGKLAYHGYSYGQRADLYELELDPEKIAKIAQAAGRLATRNLRPALRAAAASQKIVFVCPRNSQSQPDRPI